MIKIVYKTLFSLITLLLIAVIYLSIIGVKTEKFNSKIISQIKKIEPDIKLKLNDVSVTLDPFNLDINVKTIGTDLIYRGKIVEIETIKSKISLISFFKNSFSLSEISISTKSLVIKDLITFIKLLNNDPKLFIAEKFIKKGFLVADLKIEFNESGNLIENYKFSGLIKDGKIDFFSKYVLNKIDFSFEIDEKVLRFNDIKLILNKNNILISKLTALKKENKYLISGKLETNNTKFAKNDIKKLFRNHFLRTDIEEILFSSKNDFKFTLNKKLQVSDLNITSDIDLDNLKFKNPLELKKIFPKIKKNFILKNQTLKVEYKKDDLSIVGSGEALFQNEIDKIDYEIFKKKNEVSFKTKLKISNNPIKINFINFEKEKNSDLELNFIGKNNIQKKLFFNEISLKEKNNIISLKNLVLSKNNKINDIENIIINFIDDDGLKNNLRLTKNKNNYLVSGNSINVNSIIDELLNSENDEKLKLFDKNFKIIFDIKKVFLDKDNTIKKLTGFLTLNENEISDLNLASVFSDNQNIKFTIKDNGNEKVTTLYSYRAKPFVDRYKFIKGFEEGDLNFYSVKKNNTTNSILAIDNFKIQEIPVLAKLLTLASLQGIADLLTGEGIRFTDFEMKFSNKDRLMTIEELYAIGPAISILLEGYIQRKELISLRGTLVPATTVNRTISSIPLIGDILVGKKVGEGIFGVSFKIKGPPGNLETTVNPIKTLTPRFITRTLEKIKKN
ncbi:hypothetical protein IDH33_01265 [Pelagibacterales bacterium SAG-MED43]|nr:hypothetical protein [Pelagibacterales bacterium SAG-MED43]